VDQLTKNKKCTKCLETYSVECFYKNMSSCKKCADESSRLWKINHPGWNTKKSNNWRKNKPEQYKEWYKGYIQNNRERKNEVSKTHYIKNRDKLFCKKYNCTQEQLDELRSRSNEKCEICGIESKKLHIDHNHKTGKLRGILCNRCNMGIGSFEDSMELFQKVIEYLNGRN
jgi:hypothetical protein